MDLEKMKLFLKVDHDFEDELIATYIDWAKADIIHSVTTEKAVNMDFFKGNRQFEKAVVLLTSHFFENRIPFTEKRMVIEYPYGDSDVIKKLSGSYENVNSNAIRFYK